MFSDLTDDNGVILGFIIVIIIILITGFGITYTLLNSESLDKSGNIGEEFFCNGANCAEFDSSNDFVAVEDLALCDEILDVNYKNLCYQNFLDSTNLKINNCNFENESFNEICLDKTFNILFEKYSDLNNFCESSLDKLNCFKQNSYDLILNYENNNFECSDLESDGKIADCEIIITALIDKRDNSNFYNFCPDLNTDEFRKICSNDFEENII